MNSLTRFENENGIETLINTSTGEAFASISGYARIAGKDKSTISRRLDSVAAGERKTAEVQTTQGLRTVVLITESQITDWIIDDNPKIAKQLLKAGVRVFLHTTAGYQVTSTATAPTPIAQVELEPKHLDLLRTCLKSVNTALVDGFLLNEIGKANPQLAPQITEAHKLLAATTTIPDVLLTPTLIGKELGISAVKVNKLLVSTGYQIKNEKKSKGSPDYVPTELGKQYAELTMATGDGSDNTTYQHLKWDKRILDILGELV